MYDPNTPSGKFFRDSVKATAAEIVRNELGAYDKRTRQQRAMESRKRQTQQEIKDYLTNHPNATEQDVEAALSAISKRGMKIADVMTLHNARNRDSNIDMNARHDVHNQMQRAQGFPQLNAGRQSSPETTSLADQLLDSMERRINGMQVNPQ